MRKGRVRVRRRKPQRSATPPPVTPSNPPLRTLFFEDLTIGMTETLTKTIASSDVVGFAQLTGDRNPIHLSEHFAARTSFGRRIAHGLYTAGLISAVAQAVNGRRHMVAGSGYLITPTSASTP